MPILHQIKLMTTNGVDILLILIEKGLRRDIAQLEGLQRTTSMF